jgi:hypothetical protein
LNIDTLKNLLVFMDRVQTVGKEAFVWVQTYAAVQSEIQSLETSPVPSIGTAPSA